MGCTKPNQQKSTEKNKIPGPRFPNNQTNNAMNNNEINNDQIKVTENVTEPVAPIRKRKRSKDAQLYTRLVSTVSIIRSCVTKTQMMIFNYVDNTQCSEMHCKEYLPSHNTMLISSSLH